MLTHFFGNGDGELGQSAMQSGGFAGGISTVAAVVVAIVAAALMPARAASPDPALDLASTQAQRLVVPSNTVVIAAAASQEGHWTFVNAKGERFTAATVDEMRRMAGVLASEVAAPGGKLVFVVTEASVFAADEPLGRLPRDAEIRMSTATGVYALSATKPRRIRIGPKLEVEAADRATFDEILRQMDRSLARRGVRVVALEPGGPATMAPRAPLDARAKPEFVERVDPLRLKDAIGSMRGHTVIVTGRIEGKFLYFQAPSGPDRSLIIADLLGAAAVVDVNLIILDAAAGRQPGNRNWLWQRAEVAGVDAASLDQRLDGLLATLATDGRPLTVKLVDRTAERVTLLAVPGGAVTGASIGDRLARVAADLSNNVTGRIEPVAISLHMVSSARQRELNHRLVAWLPSWVVPGYLAVLTLGALGGSVSWRWWARIWPPERAGDYPGVVGLQLARMVRLATFAVLFLPLVAVIAAPTAAVRGFVSAVRPRPAATLG